MAVFSTARLIAGRSFDPPILHQIPTPTALRGRCRLQGGPDPCGLVRKALDSDSGLHLRSRDEDPRPPFVFSGAFPSPLDGIQCLWISFQL